MKRIICILTVIICCYCSTAIGETHIGIQGTVVSEQNNKTVLFDIFRNDDQATLITSTLIPDYAVRNHDEVSDIYSTVSMLLGITPQLIDSFIIQGEEIYHEWLKSRYSERSDGIYTGSLFGKASSVYTTEYMLSDLIQFIKNTESQNTESLNIDDNVILECATCFADALAAEYNPLVRMKSYDGNRFFTLDFLKQDQVILTLSVDNSTENEKRILISHRENSRYYFRDIYVHTDITEFSLLSRLYSSRGSLFENVTQDDLIISESFTLTGNVQPYSVTYDCGTEKTGKVLSLKGYSSSDQLDASIFLQDDKSENIHLSVSKDTKEPDINHDTMKVLDYRNVSDSNEYHIAFMSGLSLFLADMIPVLPVSSQKLLYQMLFYQ